MEIPTLDIEQRIGDTLAVQFAFRQDDGTLRQFTDSIIIFHGQAGEVTFHYESNVADEVNIVDVLASDKGPGATDGGIDVRIPFATTETWTDGQKFFYELKELVDGEKYTLVEGHITASLGVVDGSD